MKQGLVLGLFILTFDISVYFTPAESFTIPVSVSTGMAIIVALVKIKAIIVKVLLGLKAMGVDGFIWRRRRRRDAILYRDSGSLNSPTFYNNITAFSDGSDKDDPISHHSELISQVPSVVLQSDELLAAWADLQETVGKSIDFDYESCTFGASRSKVNEAVPWDEVLTSLSHTPTPPEKGVKLSKRDKDYSSWVSRILGSIVGDVSACHILQEELQLKSNNNLDSLTRTTVTYSSLEPSTLIKSKPILPPQNS